MEGSIMIKIIPLLLLLSFGFGQWIYDLTDNPPTITAPGDLVVTGNITHDHAGGVMHVSTGGTFQITTGGTFEKIEGGAIVYSSDHLDNFNETTDGRLTYTGTTTKHFSVAVYSSVESGEVSQVIMIRLAESGTDIAGTEKAQDYSNQNSHNDISTGYIVELATSEYLEVFITSDQDTDDVIIHNVIMVVSEI
jgi:hypothetical protein